MDKQEGGRKGDELIEADANERLSLGDVELQEVTPQEKHNNEDVNEGRSKHLGLQ